MLMKIGGKIFKKEKLHNEKIILYCSLQSSMQRVATLHKTLQRQQFEMKMITTQ